jgi:hypothetical protein
LPACPACENVLKKNAAIAFGSCIIEVGEHRNSSADPVFGPVRINDELLGTSVKPEQMNTTTLRQARELSLAALKRHPKRELVSGPFHCAGRSS